MKIRACRSKALRIAIINLRGVSTNLYFNLIFTMQTYKKLNACNYFNGSRPSMYNSLWVINIGNNIISSAITDKQARVSF